MAKQTIENTKLIKFLDERILLAKGSGKQEKIKMLQRCREIAYHYYLNAGGFAPAVPEPSLFSPAESTGEVDLFGEVEGPGLFG